MVNDCLISQSQGTQCKYSLVFIYLVFFFLQDTWQKQILEVLKPSQDGSGSPEPAESRSVQKVNDCNKMITYQTQLAAPVTECLFYFIILLAHFLKESSGTFFIASFLPWCDLIITHCDVSYEVWCAHTCTLTGLQHDKHDDTHKLSSSMWSFQESDL